MRKEELTLYHQFLGEIETRIQTGQRRAALSANAEMITLDRDTDCMIASRPFNSPALKGEWRLLKHVLDRPFRTRVACMAN